MHLCVCTHSCMCVHVCVCVCTCVCVLIHACVCTCVCVCVGGWVGGWAPANGILFSIYGISIGQVTAVIVCSTMQGAHCVRYPATHCLYVVTCGIVTMPVHKFSLSSLVGGLNAWLQAAVPNQFRDMCLICLLGCCVLCTCMIAFRYV